MARRRAALNQARRAGRALRPGRRAPRWAGAAPWPARAALQWARALRRARLPRPRRSAQQTSRAHPGAGARRRRKGARHSAPQRPGRRAPPCKREPPCDGRGRCDERASLARGALPRNKPRELIRVRARGAGGRAQGTARRSNAEGGARFERDSSLVEERAARARARSGSREDSRGRRRVAIGRPTPRRSGRRSPRRASPAAGAARRARRRGGAACCRCRRQGPWWWGRDARRLGCENSNEFSQSANLVDVQRLQPNSHFAEEMSGCEPLLNLCFALCESANCEFAFPNPPTKSLAELH